MTMTPTTTRRARHLALCCTVAVLLATVLAVSAHAQFAITIGQSNNPDFGTGIAVDGDGNSYVTGQFQNSAFFDPINVAESRTSNGLNDAFVASYGPGGTFRFAFELGGSSTDLGEDIVVDGAGNSYVTGYFQNIADFDPGAGTQSRTSNGGEDVFIASYDASGNYRFALAIGGSGNDRGIGIDIDGSGNVFVVGTFEGTVDFDPIGTTNRTSNGGKDVFVAIYGSSGTLVSVATFGGSSDEFVGGIAEDGSTNSYVTGSFQGTVDFDPGSGTTTRTSSGSVDIFIASYDRFGGLRYVNAIGAASSDSGGGIDVDDAGTSYVTGSFQGTVDFDPGAGTQNRTSTTTNGFISSYDASGAFQFASTIESSSFNAGRDIVVDGSGFSYVTGSFSGTADFDPGVGTQERTANGGQDIFVARYDPIGKFSFASALGGTGFDRGNDLSVDGSGNSYITGSCVDLVDFDPGPGTEERNCGDGNSNIFVLQLLSTGLLPVELTGFDALADGPSVRLQWQTASETNNAGFEVQHLVGGDGRRAAWQVLGWVEGHSTTVAPQRYTYRIDALAPGPHRFRLKQIDYDGTFEYSPEVKVAVGVAGAYRLTPAYPNPARRTAHLSLSVARAQAVTVAAYDLLGRRVAVLYDGVLVAGQARALAFEVSNMPSGLYMIRAEGEHFLATRPVLVGP
jgi:hypothetical protein